MIVRSCFRFNYAPPASSIPPQSDSIIASFWLLELHPRISFEKSAPEPAKSVSVYPLYRGMLGSVKLNRAYLRWNMPIWREEGLG